MLSKCHHVRSVFTSVISQIQLAFFYIPKYLTYMSFSQPSSLRIQSGTRLGCHFAIAFWQLWSEGAADPGLGADSFPLTGPTRDVTAALL